MERAEQATSPQGTTLVARADGGALLGYGAMSRMEALLDAWVELGGRAAWVGRGFSDPLRTRLEATSVEVVELPDAIPSEAALRVLRKTLKARSAHVLAVAGSQVSGSELDKLRFKGVTLAVADGSPGPVGTPYRLEGDLGPGAAGAGPGCLSGPRYALLRREFRELRPSPRAREHLVVNFGGADPARLTEGVLEHLWSRLPSPVPVVAVLGPGVSLARRKHLAQWAAERPGVQVVGPLPSMATVLADARLAILAAGATVLEAFCLQTPAVVAPVADHQHRWAHAVQTRNLGWVGPASPPVLVETALKALEQPVERAARAARAAALVDGYGALRAAEAVSSWIRCPAPCSF